MTQLISGRTRLIAHLGVPTESFKAPMIYNPYFEASGIDAVVVPMGCEAADFAPLLTRLARLRNFAGALITAPHKVAVVALLDEASPTVLACGACNVVKRGTAGGLIGEMFDGEGFVGGLRRRGCRLAGASALVVGSGGVGSAIAASLADAGLARLGLFDSEGTRSQALAGRIAAQFPAVAITTGSNDPAGWEIVVNATPLGMRPDDPLPMDAGRIDPSSVVGEVVMTRETTPFLAAAKARGCRVQVGTDMLFEQIPSTLEFFGFPSTTPETLRRLARIRY